MHVYKSVFSGSVNQKYADSTLGGRFAAMASAAPLKNTPASVSKLRCIALRVHCPYSQVHVSAFVRYVMYTCTHKIGEN